MKMNHLRRGVSLIEMFVVLGIIAVLCALLFPAVQAARERARDAVCKNNLYQTNLALVQYLQVSKKLPPECPPGKIGGWMIAILPFLERNNLKEVITEGIPLGQARRETYKFPSIYRCLVRDSLDEPSEETIQPGHMAVIPTRDRKGFVLTDVPKSFNVPWLNSPEIDYARLTRAEGPHHEGYFQAYGMSQGVDWFEPRS